MIALIGPTKLDLDVPDYDPPAMIEIALLLENGDTDCDAAAEHNPEVACQAMSPYECELVGNKLAELHAAGQVALRTEGKWLVYEVTSEICMTLLFLLLRNSSPERRTL